MMLLQLLTLVFLRFISGVMGVRPAETDTCTTGNMHLPAGCPVCTVEDWQSMIAATGASLLYYAFFVARRAPVSRAIAFFKYKTLIKLMGISADNSKTSFRL